MLPVFLSANEDPDQALNESAFEHVWDVLKALRAHDETLGEELDELRRRLGARRGAPRRPGKIKLDLPRTVGAEFARAFDVRLVEQTTASWEFYFGLLQRFVEREGHARVPLDSREDGYPLGSWVGTQRAWRARGDLDPDRERRLDGLPGWTWNAREAAWDEGFGYLQQFVQREGHARVPWATVRMATASVNGSGVQRRSYRQGTLDPQRRRRLEALPGWTWVPEDDAWEEGFAYLQRFVDREGRANVPARHREDGFALGGWVVNQRARRVRGDLARDRMRRLEGIPGWTWVVCRKPPGRKGSPICGCSPIAKGTRVFRQGIGRRGYRLGAWVTAQRSRRARGELDPDRERQLEGVPGWTWEPRDHDWEEGFAYLQQFVEREGDAEVPGSHREDGYRLGQWVTVQRTAYRKGTLDPKRRSRLEALPGWSWDTHEAAWEEGFAYLQRFVEREGRANVPVSHRENGYRLGQWAGVQRQAYRHGKLDAGRRRRLERVRGWTWTPDKDAWDEGFRHLRNFAEREGHALVPQQHREDGFRLGAWVSTQRALRQSGRLSDQRAGQLNALPGWTWNTVDAAWEEGFAHLRSFAEREGHARVPQQHREDGYKLGAWVANQRAQKRTSRLPDERVWRLDGLPGWTWNTVEAAWEDGFGHLRRFAEREGHALVPLQHREDGYKLGAWVRGQRSQKQKGTLSDDRARRLEALPEWSWQPREAAWEEGFGRLRNFTEREGHARVPRAHREDGYRLGGWVVRQRALKQNGMLSDERARLLEALPGWSWDTVDTAWEEGFTRLQRYVRRVGHSRVPATHREDGFGLGGWVRGQRAQAENGKLSDDRAQRLEALPGWTWQPREAAWEEGFAHLRRFAEREGHALVPQQHWEDGYRLGQWVGVQRTTYRQETLSDDRIRRLESLPGWLWDTRHLTSAR